MRRAIAVVVFLWVGCSLRHDAVLAHAGVRLSDPLDGATLGDTPATVRLYFSERPEPSLSSIRVLDTAGKAYQVGAPELVGDDPLSLAERVQSLPTGVYIVNWRIISAVDGHSTEGSYAFGVRMTPTVAATRGSSSVASRSEVAARVALIAGVIVTLGAAVAVLARFGGIVQASFCVYGLLIATVGLVLLGTAQRSTASASFAAVLKSSVGRALLWRAAALAAAAVALVAFRFAPKRLQRAAASGVALATLGLIAVHVANGHAAAGGRWPAMITLAAQWAHFTAAAVWIGGLAVLLVNMRGGSSATTSVAARRFSNIAAVALAIVVATGTVLTASVLSSWSRSWNELTSTAYGATVLAKVALLVGIAACAAFNRWRGVDAAIKDPRPLRRSGSIELTFMGAALVAAAMLGTLPQPEGGAPPGLTASGSDFGTTVRVRLTTPSDQPGPNRFVVEAVDYDSRAPVVAHRVSLRFTPLDDPGVAPTSLVLSRAPDGTYAGSGSNMAFDGRWRVTTLMERSGTSVEVPLEVDIRGVPQIVSIERRPGQDPAYTVSDKFGRDKIRISPHPEAPGPSQISIVAFDSIGDIRALSEVAVTVAGDDPARQLAVHRKEGDTFVADGHLIKGQNRVTVVVRTPDGTRLRAGVEITLPHR